MEEGYDHEDIGTQCSAEIIGLERSIRCLQVDCALYTALRDLASLLGREPRVVAAAVEAYHGMGLDMCSAFGVAANIGELLSRQHLEELEQVVTRLSEVLEGAEDQGLIFASVLGAWERHYSIMELFWADLFAEIRDSRRRALEVVPESTYWSSVVAKGIWAASGYAGGPSS